MSVQTEVLVIGDNAAHAQQYTTDLLQVKTKNTARGINHIRGYHPELCIVDEDSISEQERTEVIDLMEITGTEVVWV